MSNSKRRFCKRFLVSYPLLRLWFSGFQDAHAAIQEYAVTLSCFLDILIPEDLTPGATALNVDVEIISKSKRYKYYKNSLTKGCMWLQKNANTHGHENFCDLSRSQQEAIVASMEQSHPGSIENIFFHTILDDAFHYYYADPKSWVGLAYAGPPQPYGYSDYQLAPKSDNGK